MHSGDTDDDFQLEILLKPAESSNAPLPEVAKRQLRALISNLRKDIDSTTSRRRFSDFPSLHSRKLFLLKRLEAAVSPIRDLPLEIIGEILSSVSSTVDLAALSPDDPPWNFTQICSVWRNVALGLPNLWNDIAVEFRCDEQEASASLKLLLETFLSRTGNSTISLKISALLSYAYDYDPFQPFIDSIIDLVRLHMRRLRALEVQPPDIFMPIMKLPSGMVHALESVSLVFAKGDGDPPPIFKSGDGLTDQITSFELASKLRRVELVSEYSDIHLTALRFPWSQLTCLIIQDTVVDFVHGHEVLRQCKKLVSCRISIPADNDCDATLPPTLLPNLVSLTVYAHCDEDHGRFLQPFILPFLQHLELGSSSDGSWVEMHVTDLMKCSKPANFKHFHSADIWPSDLAAILAEFPQEIEELSICFSNMQYRLDSSTLNEVVTAIACGYLAPNIKSFRLVVEGEISGWLSNTSRIPRITVQCHPEDIQPAFWDFWLGLQKGEFMEVVIHDDGGSLLGVNGSPIILNVQV